MMQRTEGDDWKVIVIMTRWATNDLAGRILDSYEDVEHITYTAVQPDGMMLCDSILNRRDYELKTKEMNADIVEANYNQKPIDVSGRLYGEFSVYESLPAGPFKKWNYTDTADKGTDFRNIERLLLELGNRRCVITSVPQTQNKESRILASSAWVNRHVFMPHNWKHKYPEFYKQLMSYQKKGRNRNDDAPDVLAAIYERVANPSKSTFRVRTA
jgi:predicted phage terminase large subunit-like protein